MKARLFERKTVLRFGAAISFALLILLAQPQGAAAQQWTNNGSHISNTNSGNVGIGTANPSQMLEIAGNAMQFAAAPKFTLYDALGPMNNRRFYFLNTGGGVYGRWVNDSDSAVLAESIFFKNDGKVGIGTTTPGKKFEIVAADGEAVRLYRPANSVGWGISTTFALNNSSNARIDYAGVHGVVQANTAGGEQGILLFTTATSGALTEKMRIDTSGKVGIGTASPGYRLDVQGGQVNASGGLCIGGDCKTAWSQVGGGGSSQWTTTGSNIYYNTGNIGIGTTNPLSNLQIGSQTSGASATPTTLSLGGTYSNAAGANFKLKLYDDSASGNTYGIGVSAGSMDFGVSPTAGYNWYSGGAHKMALTGSGNVGIGTNAPTSKLHVVGDGRVTGNLTVDGNIAAKYQDLAEWVPASEQIPAGTVVVLDLTQSNKVIASTVTYDTRVAGVISDKPGIALGESGSDKVLVATTGRVRVKVDATRGPIQIGDLLVTSDKPGIAMKSEPVIIGGVQFHRPGTLIGKALEPLAKGQGEILVLLSLQ